MYFFFGLGNPGKEFKATPHNVGFEFLDYLLKEYNGPKWKKKNLSLTSEIIIEGERVLLVKPMTYMNLSGNSVKQYILKDDLKKEDFLVILDDLNLPLGRVRLRLKGSSGGHKGLSSILNVFGTLEVPRLRIGIGPKEGDATIFVLTPFPKEKLEALEGLFPDIKKGLEIYLKNKEEAMKYFNTKNNQMG
ncbi:MAG: aminoacyl-tRNA hydrolase [Thermoanaerobaculia bacterium]